MLTAVLIIAGWGVAYIALRHTVKKCCEEFRHEFQDQINTLHARVRLLDRAVATRQATALPFVAPKGPEFFGCTASAADCLAHSRHLG